MPDKKAQTGIIVISVIVILALIAVFYIYKSGNDIDIGTDSPNENEGRVVFAITDDAANLNSVSHVYVTIDNVMAQSTTEGWVDVSSTSKTYDLIELKQNNELAVIADTTLEEGSYNQIRFDVTKVVVVNASGENEAKLPSNEIKINVDMEVENNSTSTATFDFILDESLHVTGNGRYILAPVIQVETRSNTDVDVESDNTVKISGGDVKTNAKVGMNINGSVGVGLKVAGNTKLDIGNDGKIKIGSNSGISIGL